MTPDEARVLAWKCADWARRVVLPGEHASSVAECEACSPARDVQFLSAAVESLAAQVERLEEDRRHLQELRIAISNDLSDAKSQLVELRAQVERLSKQNAKLLGVEDDHEYLSDSMDRETSSNGDNAFVRWVGPWVIAEHHHDPEDGDYLSPRSVSEYVRAIKDQPDCLKRLWCEVIQ